MNTNQTDTAAGTDYTLEDRGTIVLGTTTYRVEVQHYHSTGGSETWLYGPRGAVYFLRGFIYRGRTGDTGERQVISWKSGKELRVRGNEIRVQWIGDILEQFVPAPRA